MTEAVTSQEGLVGNTVYTGLYDHLEELVENPDRTNEVVNQTLEEHAAELPEEDRSIWNIQWLIETLQGDFNPNMTVGQVAANAALGMIPIVDQLLDIRDVIANCRNLSDDMEDQAAWIALMLTLIGLFPILGSPVKGLLKIVFLYIRHGTGIGQAVARAIPAITSFVHADKVQRLIGRVDLTAMLYRAADAIDEVKKMLSVDKLLGFFDDLYQQCSKLRNRLSLLLPSAMASWLDEALGLMNRVRAQAENRMATAMGTLDDALGDVQASLRHEAGNAHPPYNAHAGTRSVHPLDHVLVSPDPAIIRGLNRTQKGLFGEIISDRYMAGKGYTNLLPADRQVRSLADKPRGRGIDGVYQNPKPPPDYIITETKFRTTGEDGKSRYIDGDGSVSDQLLSNTKGMGKQMSDNWVEINLRREFGAEAEDIALSSEKWLMLVDESGGVIGISRVDELGNVADSIPIH